MVKICIFRVKMDFFEDIQKGTVIFYESGAFGPSAPASGLLIHK